jgi:hypothetical protein
VHVGQAGCWAVAGLAVWTTSCSPPQPSPESDPWLMEQGRVHNEAGALNGLDAMWWLRL